MPTVSPSCHPASVSAFRRAARVADSVYHRRGPCGRVSGTGHEFYDLSVPLHDERSADLLRQFSGALGGTNERGVGLSDPISISFHGVSLLALSTGREGMCRAQTSRPKAFSHFPRPGRIRADLGVLRGRQGVIRRRAAGIVGKAGCFFKVTVCFLEKRVCFREKRVCFFGKRV